MGHLAVVGLGYHGGNNGAWVSSIAGNQGNITD